MRGHDPGEGWGVCARMHVFWKALPRNVSVMISRRG